MGWWLWHILDRKEDTGFLKTLRIPVKRTEQQGQAFTPSAPIAASYHMCQQMVLIKGAEFSLIKLFPKGVNLIFMRGDSQILLELQSCLRLAC